MKDEEFEKSLQKLQRSSLGSIILMCLALVVVVLLVIFSIRSLGPLEEEVGTLEEEVGTLEGTVEEKQTVIANQEVELIVQKEQTSVEAARAVSSSARAARAGDSLAQIQNLAESQQSQINPVFYEELNLALQSGLEAMEPEGPVYAGALDEWIAMLSSEDERLRRDAAWSIISGWSNDPVLIPSLLQSWAESEPDSPARQGILQILSSLPSGPLIEHEEAIRAILVEADEYASLTADAEILEQALLRALSERMLYLVQLNEQLRSALEAKAPAPAEVPSEEPTYEVRAVGSYLFDPGKRELPETSTVDWKDLADLIQDYSADPDSQVVSITIAGFSDSIIPVAVTNQELSFQRASGIAELLKVELPDQLQSLVQIQGRGAEDANAIRGADKREPFYRRVDVLLVLKK